MRRPILATVAVFSVILLSVFLVPSSSAQLNGVSSSVTSTTFGTHSTNNVPASVTSIGPRGFTPAPDTRFFGSVPPVPTNGHHHHSNNNGENFIGGTYFVPVYVPYPVDAAPEPAPEPEEDESAYQGGPTIFDRRGAGEQDYIPPVKDVPIAHENYEKSYSAPAAPEPPQDPTQIIFKDGRKIEILNYAILGEMLYDLTPGHPRKIALADLDLDATQKQNDEHGVTFQIPPASRAN